MFRRAIFTSLVLIAAGLSGCTYHMQCGAGGGQLRGGCTSCGQTECGGDCGARRGFGPLGFAKYMGTCGAGCGKMYAGEWLADPPDNCDPCDDCGNYIGRQCCMPRVWRWAVGARSMWGYRYDQAGSSCGPGCTHHAGGGEVIYDGQVRDSGQSEEELRVPVPEPEPEPEPAEPRETRSVKIPWRQSSPGDYYPRPTR
jgi:hypothetical protein